VEEGGQEAETVFHRRRIWADHDPPLALLEAELRTGRTHQIRVHLSHLGFPLAGDDKYGDFAWNKELAKEGLRRMFLHAWKLSFAHPINGRTLAVESQPRPSDTCGLIHLSEAGDPRCFLRFSQRLSCASRILDGCNGTRGVLRRST